MKRAIYCLIIFLGFYHQAVANNGDFITAQHPWFDPTRAVVPIYQGVPFFEEDQADLSADQMPQASCTGTLINEGQHLLTAAHCFRDLCQKRKLKKDYHAKQDYFTIVAGEKIFFEQIHLPPQYCSLAYELPYEEKVAPNPLFPELIFDIAVAKIKSEHLEVIREMVRVFPVLRYEESGLEMSEDLIKVGYGVSSRFVLYQTLWVDQDKDNVHDYWDLCPNTQEQLVPTKHRVNPKYMLKANGCSAEQAPSQPPLVLDYFTSNKISHKRGYTFSHFTKNDFIFESLNLEPHFFLVHHGYYGSLKPYKNLAPMSFGGDSGGPAFNDDLSEIVAITILLNNSQDFVINHIKNNKLKSQDRRDLMHSGFNVLLKVSTHKDFLIKALSKERPIH